MTTALQTIDQVETVESQINRTVKLIPIETIIEYAEREPPLSYSEIAAIVGCSRENVFQRLQSVGYTRLNRKNYEKNRTFTFQFLQSKLLNSINDDDIKGINPLQRVVAAGILYDKERLESGKSTQNINVVEVIGTISDLQAQADALRRQL